MKRLLTIAGFLTILILIGFGVTKVLNIQQIEENERDLDSYHAGSIIIYILCGIGLIVVAFFTYHFHIVAGLLPFGLGISTLGYGIYLALIKFGYM